MAAAIVSFPTNKKDSDSEDGSVSSSSIMGEDEHEGQQGVVAAYNRELSSTTQCRRTIAHHKPHRKRMFTIKCISSMHVYPFILC